MSVFVDAALHEWRMAFTVTIEFAVALPDDLAAFIRIVPTVPISAVTAFNPAGENMHAAVSPAAIFSCFKLSLHQFENVRLNYGFMVSFRIVLRTFSLADLFLFGEEVNGVVF